MSNIILKQKMPRGEFRVYDDRPGFEFLEVTQVHGKKVLVGECGEADGLVHYDHTNEGIPLAIKTADCIPLLVLGDQGYGLLHIGWRGLQQEIHFEPEVEKLKPIYFYIAPHIGADSFEVTEEFREHFPGAEDCFIKNENRLTFDLQNKLTQDLKKNYPLAKIESSNICTYSHDDFHSYRLNKTSLRNWNIYFPTSP